MKLYWKTEKFKAHQRKRSRREGKRSLQRKRWLRQQGRDLQGQPKERRKEITSRKKYLEVFAPENFSLLQNKERVLRFINDLDHCFRQKKAVFVNLATVGHLDYAAITALLSIMVRFRESNVPFNGNMPKDAGAHGQLVESKFFKKLYGSNTQGTTFDLTIENQIFTTANIDVDSKLGERIIKEASTTVWGTPRNCTGLQAVLIELMTNTNNHATIAGRTNREKWWLSVNHDVPNKKVSFVFVDYGQGIFESLSVQWAGWFGEIKKQAKYGQNTQILHDLLSGSLKLSSTKKQNRGNGLRRIKLAMERNEISALQLMTNDVSMDADNVSFTKLPNIFNGTLYYWELCYSNKNELW